MSSAPSNNFNLPSQKACEEFVRFILDFSMLMEKHVEMISKTLRSTSACMANGAESINSTTQANIKLADQFEFKNKITKKFEPIRARDLDSMFKDPVSLARPYNEEISVHMSAMQVLEASAKRFVTSLSVIQSVDDISMKRLDKTARALNAINQAMGDVLVQYRLRGELSDDFVEGMKDKLLMAMSGSNASSDKTNVFNEFLRRE